MVPCPVEGVRCEVLTLTRARIVNISALLPVSHSVNDSMSRQGGISTVQPASTLDVTGWKLSLPSTYFQLNTAITFLQ